MISAFSRFGQVPLRRHVRIPRLLGEHPVRGCRLASVVPKAGVIELVAPSPHWDPAHELGRELVFGASTEVPRQSSSF